MRRATLCVILLLICILHVGAQDMSALINEALDKRIDKLDLTGTLPQVINTIGDKTGVKIVATAAVWDLLPWGQSTNINAHIENQTLRQALDAVTRKLGLMFVLRTDAVELRPVPALMRLGKRATQTELEAIELLARTPLAMENVRPTFHQLIEAIDQKLSEIQPKSRAGDNAPGGFAIENRAGESAPADKIVPVARNATLADALEAIHSATGATWYPWGKSIVITSKEDQVRSQLLKTVTIRYSGTDVSQVLMELSQRSGVNFTIAPGAVQAIAPEFRTVRLVLDNATIKQALDTLSGFTGLGYSVNDSGVYIYSTASAGNAGRDPSIGIIQLDNGMQIIVRESQVPPDMREYFKSKLTKELTKVRQMMKDENFKPTTAPTESGSPNL